MRLFNAVADWAQTQRANQVSNMQEQGKCPDCYGNGFHPLAFNEFMPVDPNIMTCAGCNGSGSYDDWVAITQESGQ